MGYPFWVYIVATLAFVAASVLVDAICALIGRKVLPESLMNKERKLFQVSRKEEMFYQKIKINKWKNLVPELGKATTDFSKSHLDNPYDNTYISKYILEVCYGIVVHTISVPASFLVLFIDYRMYTGDSILFLTIGLPVALINAILIYLPAMVLRSNLPRLIRIYEGNKKALERAKRKQEMKLNEGK